MVQRVDSTVRSHQRHHIFAKSFENMHIQVQLPVTVCVNNTGAILLAENVTTLQNTTHIDTCSKCVRKYRGNRVVKIIFVCSDDNNLDIMMKNVVAVLYPELHKR